MLDRRLGVQAAACPKGSVERMEQVVAFSVSSYSSCQRPMRSLNPLLSETFEFVYPEKGIRLISEHVSTCYPRPISALTCGGRISGCISMGTAFR